MACVNPLAPVAGGATFLGLVRSQSNAKVASIISVGVPNGQCNCQDGERQEPEKISGKEPCTVVNGRERGAIDRAALTASDWHLGALLPYERVCTESSPITPVARSSRKMSASSGSNWVPRPSRIWSRACSTESAAR